MTQQAAGGRYFDVRLETMDRPQLESLQEQKLLEILPRAYERSALIRTVWQAAGVRPRDIRSLADFRDRVPFLDKQMLLDYRDKTGDPSAGLAPCTEDVVGFATTSGTTGDPTMIPMDRTALLPPGKLQAAARVGHQRGFWEMGIRPGDYFSVVLFTFRGPVWSNCQGVGAVPVLFNHSPADLERFCRASIELRPTGLWMMSSGLILALHELEKRGAFDLTDVFASYAGVCFAGESLGTRARDLAASWGVELFEAGSLGDAECTIECRAHDGQHYTEDEVIVEPLEPDGTDPVAEGSPGELVVTSLDPAWPLLRYRSDDLVVNTTERCTCGRTHARLWTLGRKGDQTVVGGVSVMMKDIYRGVEAVAETSAALFQVIRAGRDVDVLRLRIGVEMADARPLAAVESDLLESLSAALGVAPELDLVPVENLLKLGPPHKIPRTATS
jgi:phenylacetate-CoA ligase